MSYILIKKKSKNVLRTAEFKNIAWLISDRLWRMLLSMIVGVWVIRYLGPDNFGKINYILAYTGIAAVVANFGMESFLVKELTAYADKKAKILSSAFLLRVIASVISFLGLIIFFYATNEAKESFILLFLLAPSLMTTAFASVDFAFQSELKSKITILYRNLFFVVGIVLKIIAVLQKSDLYVFAVLTVLDVFVADIFLFGYYHFKNKSLLRGICKKTIVSMAKKSMPFLFSNLAIVLYMKIDQVLLGKLSNLTEVGYFSAATKVTEMFYFIPLVITGSLYKYLIELKKNSAHEYFKKASNIFWSFFLFGVFICIFVSFFSTFIVNLLFGSGYASSAHILGLYCWTIVPIFCGVAFSQLLIIDELQNIVLYKTIIGLILNISLNVIFIPNWGAWGATLATLITQVIASLVANLFFKKSRDLFMKIFQLNYTRRI